MFRVLATKQRVRGGRVEKEDKVIVGLIVGLLSIAVVLGVVGSYFRMKAFNRVSKTQVTYSEAFWSSLRIEAD